MIFNRDIRWGTLKWRQGEAGKEIKRRVLKKKGNEEDGKGQWGREWEGRN